MKFLFFIICLLSLQPLNAEDNSKAPSISPWLYKKLKKTEALIANKSYQQAEQSLKKALSEVKKGSYEHATVLRSLSSVYALTSRYKPAADALSQSIALKTLPEKQQQQATVNLGQLYMAMEQYRKAIQTLEPWLANNTKPNVQINVLVANAYAQLKKYRKALPFIQRAIAGTTKPEESWYQLNLALYYELEDYSAAAKVLKTIINRYPEKKTYWMQLSSIYQQLKQHKKAVSVKHLAYQKGYITSEKEILQLTNLLMYVGSPHKAARLLKTEIADKNVKYSSKNWEILSQAWRAAKEYELAIKALETASTLNAKGSLYQQLGQIYVQQENWSQAVSSLKKAIAKGGLKRLGETYLILGMSYYELEQIQQARQYFSKAKQFSKNRKVAMQWLNYINETKNNS